MMRAWAMLLAGGWAGGCSQLTVTMVRPGQVDFGRGVFQGRRPTYSIGHWSAADPAWQSALDDLLTKLRAELAAAPGGPLELKQSGALVVLDGSLAAYAYSEAQERQQSDCVDQKPGYAPIQVRCIVLLAHANVHLKATLSVMDATGKALISSVVELDLPKQAGPYMTQDALVADSQPLKIDRDAALEAARAAAAARLAAVVAPHAVRVSRMPPACDDGAGNCQNGTVSLQGCDFAGARSYFQAAATTLRRKADKKEEAANALWGLALANEFRGEAAAALEALREASALHPQKEFDDEAVNVRAEQAYSAQAAAAGLQIRCLAPAPEVQ